MRIRSALAAFAVAAEISAASGVSPRLALDLDGDGRVETVTASPGRGVVRLEVFDADGRRRADAKAPAPKGDVVPVALTSGPLGSAGALVEVVAATDAMECRTIWRYRDGALAPLPIRDAAGRALPDCAPPADWTARWETAGEGRPAAWIRERVGSGESGPLRTREAYAFAGFSLDFDAAASSVDVGGIPIPAWYAATLYPRGALETLYSRFRLADMRREPTLRIETDRARGIFRLRFSGPAGELSAPVDAYAASAGSATLGARAGGKVAHVAIRLAGDGTVPYEALVEGLGPDWDRNYSPAGAWRGGGREVFANAADEIASQDLVGVWVDAAGKNHPIEIVGGPPFRLRMEERVYASDLESAEPPLDLLLLPVEGTGGAWGVTLKGANALERVPVSCETEPPRKCRAAGAAETLRRLGARVNVR